MAVLFRSARPAVWPQARREAAIGPGRLGRVRNALIRFGREAHDVSRGLPATNGEPAATSEDNPAHIVPTMYSVPAVQERFGRSSPRP